MRQRNMDRIDKWEQTTLEFLDKVTEAYDRVQRNLSRRDEKLEDVDDNDPKKQALFLERLAIERLRAKFLEELAIRALDRTGIACSADAIGG